MNGPAANLARPGEIEKLRGIIERDQLCGLASDAKWNELLEEMRNLEGWKPRFRYRCLDSLYVSRWDLEWWYHVPMPFISVMWLEIEHTEVDQSRLPAQRTSHVAELTRLLNRIGFDYRLGTEVIRIFGYSPRDEADY